MTELLILAGIVAAGYFLIKPGAPPTTPPTGNVPATLAPFWRSLQTLPDAIASLPRAIGTALAPPSPATPGAGSFAAAAPGAVPASVDPASFLTAGIIPVLTQTGSVPVPPRPPEVQALISQGVLPEAAARIASAQGGLSAEAVAANTGYSGVQIFQGNFFEGGMGSYPSALGAGLYSAGVRVDTYGHTLAVDGSVT